MQPDVFMQAVDSGNKQISAVAEHRKIDEDHFNDDLPQIETYEDRRFPTEVISASEDSYNAGASMGAHL